MKKLAYLLAIASSLAVAASPPTTATIPTSTDATCSQLGEIAYWAATAHLAKSDERRLSEARANALQPNNVRPAVPLKLIESANAAGMMSYGNAGPGLSSLEAARADGVLAAMNVYRLCLEGSLAGKEPNPWTQAARTAEATILYDKQSIRRTSLGATLWTLTNFNATEMIEGKSHKSAKTQFEFDCQAERYRVLATIFYADTAGLGKVNSSTSQVEPWNPVAPTTMAHRLMGIVCAR
jgi:hypothetical protein